MLNRWLPAVAALLAAHLLCAAAARAQGAYAPPQPPPPAETAGGYVVVTAPQADILAAPATGAAVLLTGIKGDLFPFRAQQGEWFLVATGDTTTGWIRRGSAALMMYPEFLDPARLRESYTPPPYVPPSAYRSPGWGYPRVPYPWRDPLWWGLWLYEQEHDDDDDDHHHGHHDDDDDDDDDDRRHRNRRPPSRPVPPRDPRLR